MSKRRVLFLVLLLSLLSIMFVVSAIMERKFRYDPDLFGIHEDLTSRHLSDEKLNISDAFGVLRSLGVSKIRVPIWRWYMNNSTTIENERKNAIKQVIYNAELFGMEIMSYVQDFPSWMTNVTGDPQTVPHRNMTEGSKYRRFLKLYEGSWETLAREFPEIKVWEIGNECNLPRYLHPPEFNETDPETQFSYEEQVDMVTDLLYYGSQGINAGNPNATRVMCGLGPIEDSIYENGIYDIRDFFNSIYESIGSDRWPSTNPDDFFQVPCWHPYTSNAKPTEENWVKPNKAVYEVMKNHCDGDKHVVFSEMGYSDNCTGLSKEEIANYLTGVFRLARNNFPWLKTIYWFRLMDPDPQCDSGLKCSEYGYGVLETPRKNWVWKPAAYTYKSLTHPLRSWIFSLVIGISLLIVTAVFVSYLLKSHIHRNWVTKSVVSLAVLLHSAIFSKFSLTKGLFQLEC